MESLIDLDKFLPYRLTYISEALSRSTSMRYRQSGVTAPEWRIMAVLSSKQVASSKLLQHHTGLSKTMVNRTVESLLAKGWIDRQSTESDRRQNKITITDTGGAVFSEATRFVREIHEEWLRAFTDAERSELYRLLDKLQASIPSEKTANRRVMRRT